jgi:hypothetical protein
VTAWLSAASMDSYAALLLESGYDSLHDLKRMPSKEVEDMLAELAGGGMRKPHVNRLRREVQSLQKIFKATQQQQQQLSFANNKSSSSSSSDSPSTKTASSWLFASLDGGSKSNDGGGDGEDEGDDDDDSFFLKDEAEDAAAAAAADSASASVSAGRLPAFFPALSFARYLASVHVILNHFYAFFLTGDAVSSSSSAASSSPEEHDWSAVYVQPTYSLVHS